MQNTLKSYTPNTEPWRYAKYTQRVIHQILNLGGMQNTLKSYTPNTEPRRYAKYTQELYTNTELITIHCHLFWETI